VIEAVDLLTLISYSLEIAPFPARLEIRVRWEKTPLRSRLPSAS
jgi:hypothetical protein